MKFSGIFVTAAALLPRVCTSHTVELRDAQINGSTATVETTGARAPISDSEWQTLGAQGCGLLKAMASTDAEAAVYVGATGSAESPWKDFNSVHNGVTYRKTLGIYENIFNVREGVIVRSYNWGPRCKANRFNPPITPLPALRNWADVIYLDWMHTAPTLKPPATGTKLQLIIAHGISSDKTIALIDRALRAVGRSPRDTMLADKECPQYRWKDRVTFPLGDGQPGNPILASPNGLGQSLLLIRNKGTFGAKLGIDQITYWCKGSDMNLLFHVNQGP